MIPNFVHALILSTLLFIHINALDLKESDLRSQCPKDKEICFGKALEGECFGSSLKAKVCFFFCKL